MNNVPEDDNLQSRIFTGAEFIVNALVSTGVTHVFGGHGGSVVPLIDEIMKHPSLTWVYCRCEVNASQAAAAYAKLHGRLGCCVATSGPGAAHLLSGLVDADQDRVPVLCITGMKDTTHLHNSDFQDIDQGAIVRMAGLAYSEAIADINQLPALCRNAFTVAVSSNRACHLAVPVDIQQKELEARTHFCLGTAYQHRRVMPSSPAQIEAFALALRAEVEAKRHVLIACGWRARHLGVEIEQISEMLRAPILTSFDAKGTVNEKQPLSFGVVGVYGNAGTPSSVNLLEDCDTVISICVSDLTELLANKKGLQVRRLIQVDEQLVGGDALRFSPSTVFSCGRLQESLRLVVKALQEGLSLPGETRKRCSMIEMEETMNFKELHIDQSEDGLDVWDNIKIDYFSKPAGTPSTFLQGESVKHSKDIVSTEFCHPAVFFNVMEGLLKKEAVICADIGDNALWMASSLVAKRGQRFLTSEHMGIMGYAINAGLAASVSASHTSKQQNGSGTSGPKQTLVVAGDGGIQMSLNELATMKDHNSRNILVVVIVNSRLGRVQNETWGERLKADGCHIGSPDYIKLFEAYGYPDGMKLSTCDLDKISDTIKKGWERAEKNGVCVIELAQDPHVHPIMHKLTYNKKKTRRSLMNWEETTRNTIKRSIFPEIATDHWKEHQEKLQNWLNSLSSVKLSEKFWLNKEEYVTFSPSRILQTQLESLLLSETPQLFKSIEGRMKFDTQVKASCLNSFPPDVIKDVLESGISNTHPLCFQLMACPKNFNFDLHAHPNIELDIPLVGDLWERRSLKAELSKDMLKRDEPVVFGEGKFFKDPTNEELEKVMKSLKERAVYEDMGTKGEFIDREAKQGQVLFNTIGSVHQTYTKNNGVLIFAFWSGVHAHFAKENFRQKTGTDNIVLD